MILPRCMWKRSECTDLLTVLLNFLRKLGDVLSAKGPPLTHTFEGTDETSRSDDTYIQFVRSEAQNFFLLWKPARTFP